MLCVVAWFLWFPLLSSVLLRLSVSNKTAQSSAGPFPIWPRAITATSVSEEKKNQAYNVGALYKKAVLLNSMMVLCFRRTKTLPPRPSPAKPGPGRPPPPTLQATGRSLSVPWETSPKPQMPPRKGPILPPRPKPGHRLYNKYIVRELPLYV